MFSTEPLNSLKRGLCFCIRRTTSCLKDFLQMFYSREFHNFEIGIILENLNMLTFLIGNEDHLQKPCFIFHDIKYNQWNRPATQSAFTFILWWLMMFNLLICLCFLNLFCVCVGIYSNLFPFSLCLGCVLKIGSFIQFRQKSFNRYRICKYFL